MPNNPHELTEEQLKRLEDYECSGQYSCNHETSEKHYIIDKDDLINELTTAHQQGVEAERKQIKEKYDALDNSGLPSDELCYEFHEYLQNLTERETE